MVNVNRSYRSSVLFAVGVCLALCHATGNALAQVPVELDDPGGTLHLNLGATAAQPLEDQRGRVWKGDLPYLQTDPENSRELEPSSPDFSLVADKFLPTELFSLGRSSTTNYRIELPQINGATLAYRVVLYFYEECEPRTCEERRVATITIDEAERIDFDPGDAAAPPEGDGLTAAHRVTRVVRDITSSDEYLDIQIVSNTPGDPIPFAPLRAMKITRLAAHHVQLGQSTMTMLTPTNPERDLVLTDLGNDVGMVLIVRTANVPGNDSSHFLYARWGESASPTQYD